MKIFIILNNSSYRRSQLSRACSSRSLAVIHFEVELRGPQLSERRKQNVSFSIKCLIFIPHNYILHSDKITSEIINKSGHLQCAYKNEKLPVTTRSIWHIQCGVACATILLPLLQKRSVITFTINIST